ncbi:nuclear transport factor 2 family protein [Halomarina litorea]|uniref:nuclear transport factor 2 family protein n=1 Tax=Halomarina litorea TaxID=2961595 RepID=UPI0020C2CCF4|nr:nuclear transport factor 2 family protein [Halomarina sp. BCD28]
MSGVATQSNVERAEALYRAFARGNFESVTEGMTEDVTWIEAEGAPYGGTYIGPESVVDHVFTPLAEDWTEFHVVTERFVDGGDVVVVTGTYRGTHATTDRRFEAPFAHVLTMRDGKLARFEQYTDTYLVRQAV